MDTSNTRSAGGTTDRFVNAKRDINEDAKSLI